MVGTLDRMDQGLKVLVEKVGSHKLLTIVLKADSSLVWFGYVDGYRKVAYASAVGHVSLQEVIPSEPVEASLAVVFHAGILVVEESLTVVLHAAGTLVVEESLTVVFHAGILVVEEHSQLGSMPPALWS